MKFAGKVAVVTGSGRAGGLGEAIARRLSEQGAAVVISDIGASRDAATPDTMIGGTDEMRAIAEALPGTASIFPCDVRNPEQVRAMAAHAVAAHGSLDIWINNAGIGYIMKPLAEVSPDDWRAVIDVNLSGAWYGLQAAAEIMGLVRSASIELGPHGITVNNVCPNHVTTGLGKWQNEHFAELQGISVEQYLQNMAARIPLGRAGLPTDTAAAVAFLCSDDASYITGESMNVSGGEEPH